MTDPTAAQAPDLGEIEAAAKTDRSRAIDLAIRALGAGLEAPLVSRLVAEGLAEDRRWQDAAALLHAATLTHPGDAEVLKDFGRMLVKLNRLREALTAFDRALAIAPEFPAAHMGAGYARLALNQVAEARRHFDSAAAINPEAAEPISALAVIAARQGDTAQARLLAERALIIRPDLPRAQSAIAEAEMADGEPALAEGRLKWLVGRSDLDDEQRADALSFLADAVDALDRPGEAFAFYSACNQIVRHLYAPTMQDVLPQRRIEEAQRLATWFEATPAESWSRGAGEDRRGAAPVRGHAFLLGFPRSGTTLLETVLASHPDVATMEETVFLAQAGGDFLNDDESQRRLESLDDREADERRDVYWRSAQEFFGVDISGKVIIDKLPLHTLNLPVIAKLFPDAKILFARRDPRDVVLSCFRRKFRMNSAMYAFLTLEGAAAYYHEVMRLAEIYLAKLPLQRLEIRNEDLIADFEGVTRRMLRFIGLDWDPGVRDFPARALTYSNTPSAPQVARGLNASGVGQWRRYRRELAPVLPILDPWVARFGYDLAADEDRERVPDARLAAVLHRVAAATGAGDWPRAFAEVDAAFARGFDHPVLRRVRGVRGQREGRFDAAIADFELALADAPGDVALLSALGLCLARGGRYVDALAKLDTAIALDPAFAPAHYNRGWALENLVDLAGARQAYERAVQIDPNHARALGNLAAIGARAGDWPRARLMAERVLELDPGQPVALTALAGAEAADGAPAAGEARLRALLAGQARATAHERAVALNALADLLDQQQRPGEAFAAYEAAGALFHDLYAAGFAGTGAETSLVTAQRLIGFFEAAPRSDWRRPARSPQPQAAKGHVFLIGFPRSGTTMLGQTLAGHPDAVTLDERDSLAQAVRSFLRRREDLTRLATIGEAEVDQYRDAYWRRVGSAGAEIADKIVIDKQPMAILALPIIVKLFPDAKILVLRRDPRDVVLSAFMRRFTINATTVDFLSLPSAARLHDEVMRLMGIYEAKLDLDLRIQNYETLVGAFETEMRAICDFVGLDWRPGMADFAGRAGAVATPSSAQIAKGLNAEGIGRWRRYAEPLAPVMPILAPWVERFGYSKS